MAASLTRPEAAALFATARATYSARQSMKCTLSSARQSCHSLLILSHLSTIRRSPTVSACKSSLDRRGMICTSISIRIHAHMQPKCMCQTSACKYLWLWAGCPVFQLQGQPWEPSHSSAAARQSWLFHCWSELTVWCHKRGSFDQAAAALHTAGIGAACGSMA